MNSVNHHEHKDVSRSKEALRLAITATIGIFIVELIGGIWTNSLALFSDAAHVFMDLFSFVLSLSAILLAERPVSDNRTFGWHRMEVFTALINGLTIFLIAFFILFQAFKRITTPEEILGPQMVLIALFGLMVNLLVIWKLHPHIKEDINVRSAFLHAFGDAVASVAVVGSGALILITKKQIIDPLAAGLVSLIILVNGYKILRDSFQILMEGVPKGLKKNLIVESIEEIAGKKSVQDLHVWNLCSHICALSVHIMVPENKMTQQKSVLENINLTLEKKFNIVHTTIQIQSDQWLLTDSQDLKQQEEIHNEKEEKK